MVPKETMDYYQRLEVGGVGGDSFKGHGRRATLKSGPEICGAVESPGGTGKAGGETVGVKGKAEIVMGTADQTFFNLFLGRWQDRVPGGTGHPGKEKRSGEGLDLAFSPG